MRRLFGITMIAATFAAQGVTAEPVERVVWGEVVDVVPITETVTPRLADDCDKAKPAAATLAATLRWDLRPECVRRNSVQTLGYRVSYRWDGRTYVRQMDKDPGRRVPLLVKIAAVEGSR